MERTYDDEERDIQLALNHHARILRAFEKFRKGALAGLHAGAHAEFQLHNTEAAQEARNALSKQGKKVVAHARGGPIYVEDARATVKTREELQIEKDNRFLVKQWEAEAIEREAQELETAATLARAAGRMAEFYNELVSNETIGFYSTLRPQGTIEGFDEFDSEELEDLEGIMS
jgi:hypothetical protein